MTTIGVPIEADPRLPARLHADWQHLARPTEPPERFDPAVTERLPAAVRRWLLHAIAPGTPSCHSVVLRQRGTIRLGAWRPFTATQVLAPLEGFLWSVKTRLFGLPVRGVDRYSGGTGEMRHRLAGLVTVVAATGPDVDRSAAARNIGEIILAPAAALDPQVRWRSVDDGRATAVIPCGPWLYEPTLTVSPTGAPQQVTIPRWTNVGGTAWHEEPFTAVVHAERTFGATRSPRRSRRAGDTAVAAGTTAAPSYT